MPRALTNANGQLVWSTFQRPNGEVGEKTIADPLTGSTVVTNVRLPGQYDERLFAAAGLGLQGPYYNWNRWYLPGAGRYLEPDPMALESEMNGRYAPDWYHYASGNPLRFADPRGLCVEDLCIGEAALLFTAATAIVATWEAYVAQCSASGTCPWQQPPDACEMGKGGKQNIDNEYVRQARQLPRNVDPCAWLQALYASAQDSSTRMKIKLAQKALGCRHSSGGGP